MHVVLSASRGDEDWRIDGSATKIVFPIRANAEVCRVAIESSFHTPLQHVPICCQSKVQLPVEEISES